MKSISNNIQCPVSQEMADEHAIRLTAGINFVVAVVSLYFKNPWVFLFLGFDFALRSFTSGNASILKRLTRFLVVQSGIQKKLVPAAPKKFAAGLGLVFCLIIAIFLLTGMDTAAMIAGGALAFCAFLESVFSYCVGCLVYTYTVLPFRKKS